MTASILTLNAGSSSVKFALYARGGPTELARGQVEGLGATIRIQFRAGKRALHDGAWGAAIADHRAALGVVIALLSRHFPDQGIAAVGHRIVHGGATFAAPVVLDDGTIATLHRLESLAPLHQPHNLAGVAAARAAFPDAPQIGCFDTAFHRTQPWVADTYALPRSYYDRGIRRYGFHGLSYEYLAAELGRVAPTVAAGRVIAAHLGNGASLCAMRAGRAVATTMGFSPLDGLPMGTRCGQIDPGVLLYLIEHDGLDAKALGDLLNRESGLKGLSGLGHDVRVLEAAGTPEASRALDYFVHRIVRECGALAAELGGLDGVVFSGGIGENAAGLRGRVAQGLNFLGLALDLRANEASDTVISAPGSAVAAYVIRTDEEAMIARHVERLLAARA